MFAQKYSAEKIAEDLRSWHLLYGRT